MKMQAVSSDEDLFWIQDFWLRLLHGSDITDELMSEMKVHGTCKATDGTYICCRDTGHRGIHTNLRNQYVTFGVSQHVNN
jgi:hypothetical protein